MGHPADERHPGVETVHASSGMPTLAGHARQAFPKGAVEAFDQGRSENRSSMRRCQQRLGPLHDPMSHPAGPLHHTLARRPRDHRPHVEIWPHRHARFAWAWRARDLFAKRSSNAGRIRAAAIGQNEHGPEWLRTATKLLEERLGQPLLSAHLHRSSEPQTRGHHHGETHPCTHWSPFHSDRIGLDRDEVPWPLLHDGGRDLLAVLPGPIAPIGHRSLIETKRLDAGLHRASRPEQDDDDDDPFGWLASPLEQRSTSCTERLLPHLPSRATPWFLRDRRRAWPLAEHATWGHHGLDVSIGSGVGLCIRDRLPLDAGFFSLL